MYIDLTTFYTSIALDHKLLDLGSGTAKWTGNSRTERLDGLVIVGHRGLNELVKVRLRLN